jgi:pimeloyl-ACP methyl ester carboxylesterase
VTWEATDGKEQGMATIIVYGIRLAYEETGIGPPVVWVHGGFTDRRGSDLLVPRLAQRFRMVTYDRRGHSQSERVPGRQAVMDHVGDLAALIEQLDAAPAHLLGHSDGGEIALKLAVQRPELVASVCLHEPSLYGVISDDRDVKEPLEDLHARLERVVAELEQGNHEAAARALIDDPAVMGPGAWNTLPEQSRRTFIHNAPTWLDYAKDPTQGILPPDRLATVAMPVLLTTGADSDPVDHAIAARLATALPHAHHVTLPGAGHVPHYTHADEFARVLSDFIANVATRPT